MSNSNDEPNGSSSSELASSSVVAISEKYYDSSAADNFYFNIWGGEDIHIGIYESADEPIAAASQRTVVRLAESLPTLEPATRVIDLGAGYGGAARYLAKRYGCHVTCLNLSTTQNARNRVANESQGLYDNIDVVHGNFESLPAPDDSFDIAWSQDAILHSGNRKQVLAEIGRVLRPGGHLVFTDPMQADDCPPNVLQPILDRIHLESLGSVGYYRQTAAELGFEESGYIDLSEQLRTHYARVAQELRARYDEIVTLTAQDYVDRMLVGLQHWVDGADRGYLSWGILHFRLPG